MTFRTFTLLTLLALGGCASAPTANPNGTHTVIDGIDIWKGTPSRPYQVISTISHQGPDSSANYADEEKLIAEDAKKSGADGAIILYAVMVPSRISPTSGRRIMAPQVAAQLIKYQ